MDKKYISHKNFENEVKCLDPRLAITRGKYDFPAHCDVQDLDWNHMDFAHRPQIHNTYKKSLRIYLDPAVSINLTRIGPLQLFMLVTDIRLEAGLFYQIYTIFNLIYVHGTLRNLPNGTTFEWAIVSHRWLRFLHPIISRKLYNLNKVQIDEDVPIRVRRAELKAMGFSFGEKDDYFDCNANPLRTRYPVLKSPKVFDVNELVHGVLNTLSSNPIDLLVRREGPDGFRIWTVVCPHDGGPLDKGQLCKEGIVCPWHGYTQKGFLLSPQCDKVDFQTFECRLLGPEWKIALTPRL